MLILLYQDQLSWNTAFSLNHPVRLGLHICAKRGTGDPAEPLFFLWDLQNTLSHCHIGEQTPPMTILCVKHLRNLLDNFGG